MPIITASGTEPPESICFRFRPGRVPALTGRAYVAGRNLGMPAGANKFGLRSLPGARALGFS